LAAKDWFFSDIHRALITGYYMNNKVKLPLDVQKAFKKFDSVRLMKDPEGRRFDLAMQTVSTKAS